MEKTKNLPELISPMTSENNHNWKSAWHGTKSDFKNSWHMLWDNYRAFLATELFAIVSLVLTIIVLVLIRVIMNDFSFSMDQYWIEEIVNKGSLWIIVSLVIVLLFGFMSCQYGLAWEIMSSGEMFAEFKSSFKYFRKYWLKYSILAILTGFVQVFIPTRSPRFHSEEAPVSFGALFLLIFLIGMLIHLLSAGSFPSVTAQGSLKNALIESFRMFRADPKRVFLTSLLYYVCFLIPNITFQYILSSLEPTINPVILILNLIFGLNFTLVGLPMRALLNTGLYNNIKFEKFPQKMIES